MPLDKDRQKYRYGTRCAIKTCDNVACERTGIRSYYRFPSDDRTCEAWVRLCGRSDLIEDFERNGIGRLFKNYCICSDHFAEKDFMNPRMKSSGVIKLRLPSLKLPPNVTYPPVLSKTRAPFSSGDRIECCCIPGCKNTYASLMNAVRLFEPPTDPALFARWEDAVPGEHRPLNADDRLCELHFLISEIERSSIVAEGTGGPRLKPGTVPSVFTKKTINMCMPASPAVFVAKAIEPVIDDTAQEKGSKSKSKGSNSTTPGATRGRLSAPMAISFAKAVESGSARSKTEAVVSRDGNPNPSKSVVVGGSKLSSLRVVPSVFSNVTKYFDSVSNTTTKIVAVCVAKPAASSSENGTKPSVETRPSESSFGGSRRPTMRSDSPPLPPQPQQQQQQQHPEMSFEKLRETGSTLCSRGWIYCCNDDYACFAMLTIVDGQVNVRLSVSVSKVLEVEVFNNGQKAVLAHVSKAKVVDPGRIVTILTRVQRAKECVGFDVEMSEEEVVGRSDEGVMERSNVWRHRDCFRMTPKSGLCRPCKKLKKLLLSSPENARRRRKYKKKEAAVDSTLKTDVAAEAKTSQRNEFLDEIERFDNEEEDDEDEEERRDAQLVLKVEEIVTIVGENVDVMMEEEVEMNSKREEEIGIVPLFPSSLDESMEASDDVPVAVETTEMQCKYCDKLVSAARYKNHLVSHEGQWKCDECTVRFPTRIKLIKHLQMHRKRTGPASVPPGRVRCDQCQRTVESELALAGHKLMVHSGATCFVVGDGAQPYRCKECGKAFVDSKKVKHHYRLQHIKDLKCAHCDRAFARNVDLQEHVAIIHQGKFPYQCDICGKVFKRNSALHNHKYLWVHSKHCDDRPFACHQCKKAFKSPHDLRRHLKVHVPISDRALICEICSKQFLKASSLSQHMTIHTGELDFECDLCDKRFRLRETLKRHVYNVHSEDRPKFVRSPPKAVRCPLCPFEANCTSKLDVHVKQHRGEKPFECPTCGKRFLLSSGLVGHQRIHTGEKPFVCRHCGKAFTFYSNMLVHSRSKCELRPSGGADSSDETPRRRRRKRRMFESVSAAVVCSEETQESREMKFAIETCSEETVIETK